VSLDGDIERARKDLQSMDFNTRSIDKVKSKKELEIEKKHSYGFRTLMGNNGRTGYAHFQTPKEDQTWLLLLQTSYGLKGFKKLMDEKVFDAKLHEKMDFIQFSAPNIAAGYNRIFSVGDNFIKIFNFKGDLINNVILDSGMPIKFDPVYYNNSLLIHGMETEMQCFDRDGELKWTYDTGCHGRKNPPTMLNDAIYHIKGTSDTIAVALNYNGKEIWSYDNVKDVESSPVVIGYGKDRKIIYGTQDGLIALNHKGKLKWRFKTEKPSEWMNRRPPTCTFKEDKLFYCMPERNKLYCVNPKKGKLLWETNIPMNEEEFDYPPSVLDNRLFMPGYGKVTAYEIQKKGLKKLWDVNVEEGQCTTPTIMYGGRVIMFKNFLKKATFSDDNKLSLVIDNESKPLDKSDVDIAALPMSIGIDKHLIA